MIVKEIVKKYLEDRGFDGLYHSGRDCSCAYRYKDEFMACDEPNECRPGYVRECNHDICDGEYEYCV